MLHSHGVSRVVLAVVMHVSFSSLCAVVPVPAHQPAPAPAPVRSWFALADEGLQQYSNVLSLVEALAHVPYVVTLDSENPSIIKKTAVLSGSTTTLKVLVMLGLKQNKRAGLVLLWEAPLMGCYLFSQVYDYIRYIDATKVAIANKTDKKKLTTLKMNQGAQLLIEIVLRVLSIVNAHQADGAQNFAPYASGLADLVSAWRLLTRYFTYFTYNEMFEIKISINKKEVDGVSVVSLEIDEKELAELEKQASDVETRQAPVQLNEQA